MSSSAVQHGTGSNQYYKKIGQNIRHVTPAKGQWPPMGEGFVPISTQWAMILLPLYRLSKRHHLLLEPGCWSLDAYEGGLATPFGKLGRNGWPPA